MFIKRGGRASTHVVAMQKQLFEAGQGLPQLPESPPEPALRFGKHKGTKLRDMLSSDDATKKGYISWLFASSSSLSRGAISRRIASNASTARALGEDLGKCIEDEAWPLWSPCSKDC